MYEVNALFWYRILFTAELVFAEALTVYRMRRRRYFVLRLFGALLIAFGCAFAVPIVDSGAAWMSAMFLIIFLSTVGGLKLCFDEPMMNIVFCAVFAYTLQHISYQLNDLVTMLMGGYRTDNPYGSGGTFALMLYGYSGMTYVVGNPFTVILYAYIYGMTYFFGYLAAKKRIEGGADFRLGNAKIFLLAVLILFFDIVISSVVLQYSARSLDRFYVILLDMYNIFCCLFAVLLQFGIVRSEKLQNDLNVAERLWNEKREQYAITKENIDIINRKCHDLKHQLRRADGTLADASLVSEIEDVIAVYDTSVHTGNDALDIIITEKSLLCNKLKIRLCVVADGGRLDFMPPSDLYALFGNIIDNAIEAVRALSEDKRTIALSVAEKNGFIVINIHNRYDGEIKFDGALPATTKADKTQHGFGMKSVLSTCEKYGGEMSIRTEKNVFNLNMIFPVKDGLRV